MPPQVCQHPVYSPVTLNTGQIDPTKNVRCLNVTALFWVCVAPFNIVSREYYHFGGGTEKNNVKMSNFAWATPVKIGRAFNYMYSSIAN